MLRTPTARFSVDVNRGTGMPRRATTALRLQWSIEDGVLRSRWCLASEDGAKAQAVQPRRSAA